MVEINAYIKDPSDEERTNNHDYFTYVVSYSCTNKQ